MFVARLKVLLAFMVVMKDLVGSVKNLHFSRGLRRNFAHLRNRSFVPVDYGLPYHRTCCVLFEWVGFNEVGLCLLGRICYKNSPIAAQCFPIGLHATLCH